MAQRRTDTIAKILILTFNDDEEKAIEKVLSVLSDEIGLEAVQPVTSSVLSFPGLEIKLYQRRVLRDGEDVPLTRLEYGTLAYLASSPGRVFTQEQIFEAVWDMNFYERSGRCAGHHYSKHGTVFQLCDCLCGDGRHGGRRKVRPVSYLPDLPWDLLLCLAGGYLNSYSDRDTCGTAQEERGGAGRTKIRIKKWGCRDRHPHYPRRKLMQQDLQVTQAIPCLR